MIGSPQSKYQPLDLQKSEIRVLFLSGSVRNSMVRAKLANVDLDDFEAAPCHFYEALSYTWGPVTGSVRCKLNGFDHWITPSLEAALKSLRGRTRPRCLWVDQLCINQDDLAERARQVRLMRRIYEQAEQVLVWLGPADDETVEAIKLIDYITSDECPEHFVERSLLWPEHLPRWRALATFFHRPWFRRVWIRQEAACAKDLMVICGRGRHMRLNWWVLIQACDDIDAFYANFEHISYGLSKQSSGLRLLLSVDLMREQIQKGENIGLETLMLHGKSVEATDPKDLIYGLLGLAGSESDNIKIDYSRTADDVFKEATVCVLQQQQSLDPLSGCQWSETSSEFPSWVLRPDVDFDAMVLRNDEESKDLYHAASSSQVSFSFDHSGSELLVDGHIIDRIVEVDELIPTYNDDLEVPNVALQKWLRFLIRTVTRRSSPLSAADTMNAFCRTLVADRYTGSGRRADAADIAKFAEAICTVTTADGESSTIDVAASIAKLIAVMSEELTEFTSSFLPTCDLRRPLATATGLFGLAGPSIQPGDLVCILLGAGVPFILRPDAHDKYILICEAYVDGIMDGEALKSSPPMMTFRIR